MLLLAGNGPVTLQCASSAVTTKRLLTLQKLPVPSGPRSIIVPVLVHRSRHVRALRPLLLTRNALSSGADAVPSGLTEPKEGPLAKLKHVFTPFHNPVVNRKLLALCFAQMLCSVATLMHDTYLPVYLSEELGLTNTKIGNLQAVSQFLCNASKSVSGTLADLLSPARMIIFGTLLTTINKPMFAFSGSVYALFGTTACIYWITFGKVFDRMSKGIREAPSKALIGDLAAEAGDKADAAFSLRQAMGTAGALVGASTAALAYTLSGRNYVTTFALASAPALLAFLLVTVAFGGSNAPAHHEAATPKSATTTNGEDQVQLSFPQKAKAFLSALQPAYWQALIVVSILYFARFDAGFVMLRAKSVMPKAELPLLTSIMMITQALLSTAFGLRAKASVAARNKILLLGGVMLVGANAAFALLNSTAGMMLGSLLVGIHMAMTHGITLAMVSSYIPNTQIPGIGRVNGTAWSFTDFVFGIILAYSNSLAGSLADLTAKQGNGNIGCFFGGAAATVASMLALLIFSQFGHLGREDLVVQQARK